MSLTLIIGGSGDIGPVILSALNTCARMDVATRRNLVAWRREGIRAREIEAYA